MSAGAPVGGSPPAKGRLWLRVLAWAVGGLALLGTVALAAVSLLLSHLDAGPVRSRILSAVHDSAGIDLDFARAEGSLTSGITLHDVTFPSAPADRALAPEIARLRELHLGWSPGALLGGRLGELRLSGLSLTLVEDESGATSLDRWNARRLAITGPPPPSAPLSHLIEQSLPASPVALDKLSVEEVTVTVLRTRGGAPWQRLGVGTLSLTGHARAGPGLLDAAFNSGTAEKPITVEISQASLDAKGLPVAGSERSLVLPAALGLACKPKECALSLAVSVTRHDLAPELPAGALLGLQAKLGFEPEHDRVIARLERLSLIDDAARLSSEVELYDDPRRGAVLRAASGHAALEVLLGRLRDLAPAGTRLSTGTLDLAVEEAKAQDGSALAETRIPGQGLAIAAGRQLRMEVALGGVEARSGEVPVRLRSLQLQARAAGGKVSLGGKLQGIAQGAGERPAVEIDEVSLEAALSPRSDGKVDVRATLPVSRLQLRGPGAVELKRLTLGVAGVVAPAGPEGRAPGFDGDLTLALGEARQSARGVTSSVRDLQFKLGLAGASYATKDPLESQAGLALQGTIAEISQAQGKRTTRATGLGLQASTRLGGRALARTEVRMPIARVALEDAGGGPRLAPQPATLALEIDPLALDLKDPSKKFKLHAALEAGPLRLEAGIDKNDDELRFALDLSADALGALAELMRGSLPAGERAAWAEVGLSLHSKGTARGIDRRASLNVEQVTGGTLTRVSVKRPGLDFSAREVGVRMATRGTLQRHTFELAIDLLDPRLASRGGEGKQTLTLTGAYDLGRPHLDLRLAGQGILGPDGRLDASAAYDIATRRLTYRLDGSFARLGLLGVLLPPATLASHKVDFDALGLKAHAEGSLPSVVRKYQPGMPPKFELEQAPLTALRGSTALDFTVTGLDYGGANDLHAAVPEISLHLKTQADEKRLHGEASVTLPSLRARAAGHQYAGEQLRTTLVADAEGDLETGTATAQAGFTAKSLAQDQAPQYPLGDVEISLTARADAKGSVRIESSSFTNARGGTRLDLHGGLDLGPLDPNLDLRRASSALASALAGSLIPGRRNLLLEGQLAQRLEAVDGTGKPLGRGTVTMPFRVESGDLSYLRATAGLKFEEVDLALPASGLSVTGLNGFIPVAQELLLDDKGGVTRIFGAVSTAYSRLRFSDQQPFTADNPYVTAQRIEIDLSKKGEPGRTIVLGPLAGNVRIDRNLVAIDQLELELARGKVSGQILFDQGTGTQLTFRGALTGLYTEGSDERLDANAALVLWPTRRLLEGRIELVRLGTSHLRKLLDLYDPYQADVAANRMRRALQFGYPRSVRMGFHDGFASLALELGGLASAVRIDEIRGTAVGPVLERYLATPAPPEEPAAPAAPAIPAASKDALKEEETR